MNKDRKEYYRNYRLNHKEQYRKYSKKYRENNLTTYERLKQENKELHNKIDKHTKDLIKASSINERLHNKIDKAIRMLEINIELTKQQPSNNELEDKFFINRCNDVIKILKDSDVDE